MPTFKLRNDAAHIKGINLGRGRVIIVPPTDGPEISVTIDADEVEAFKRAFALAATGGDLVCTGFTPPPADPPAPAAPPAATAPTDPAPAPAADPNATAVQPGALEDGGKGRRGKR